MPKWFIYLKKTLSAYGLEILNASVGGGVFHLLIGDGCVRLDLELRERKKDQLFYAQTNRFGLTYGGTADLSPGQRKLMDIFLEIIRKIEGKIPARPTLPPSNYRGAAGDDLSQKINQRFFFCTLEASQGVGGQKTYYEAMVRLTSKCNQKCPFCSGEPLFRNPRPEEIINCLDFLAKNFNNVMITVTGGEPMLCDKFVDYLSRLVRYPSLKNIQIQTNAAMLSSERILKKIPKSKKIHFFVSFHGAEEKIYDQCTGTKGQFKSAILGIQNLLAQKFSVIINCVINKININHLSEYVLAMDKLFGQFGKPLLHFSTLICSEYNPQSADYLVRYSKVAKKLEGIYKLASNNKIEISPLLSSTHAAIPPCFIKEELRNWGSGYLDVKNNKEIGYEDADKRWVKSMECKKCRYNNRCLGLPREYVKKFGLKEIKPVN